MENGTRLLAETLMELGEINNDLQSRVNGVEWELERAKEELELERNQFKKYRAGADVEMKNLTSLANTYKAAQADDLERHLKMGEKLRTYAKEKETECLDLREMLKSKSEKITILEVGITNAMKSIVDRKVLRKLKELLK